MYDSRWRRILGRPTLGPRRSGSRSVIDYLTYVATDQIPLEFMKYAITKEHSDSPAAIKTALESLHNKSFFGVDYDFSSTDHFGETGEFAVAVCHVGPPYAGGIAKVPVKA